MLEFIFLKPVVRFLGLGWSVRFTSGKDSYPAIQYRCPFCHGEDAWVAGINGFGVAPVPKCCANATPYPTNDESFVVHLKAKPRFSDGKAVPTRFLDMDEGSGETGYVRGNPAVMTR
jgi:hypothetical protein